MNDDLKLFESVSVIDSSPWDRSEVETLVLQLINIIKNNPSENYALPEGNGEKEIIIEIKFEGVNYILTRDPIQSPDHLNHLSPREIEIARLIAKGHPNKIIAEILEISPYTVATHIRRTFNKLDVKSRAEMIAMIMKCYPHIIRTRDS